MSSASKSTPLPSSATTGFVQPTPQVANAFYEDEAYKRVFSCYLPTELQHTLTGDLARFGARVLEADVLRLVEDAERHPPYTKTWDSFGHRGDSLVTSEGWRGLSAIGIREGMVAIPYEKDYGPYSRVYQFLKYHLWTGSSAIVTCPSAMTDGAARLLSRQLERNTASPSLSETERTVFENAFQRLTSRDPQTAWTSGQWMTERPGGSDVQHTETQAKRVAPASGAQEHRCDAEGLPLGPWSIDGFKWFSSATDSQMAVLLAKTPGGHLSAFYAPMRRRRQDLASSPTVAATPATELNGVQIQRLKSKLGTRAVPTAELVLSDMRAYILGSPGAGVKQISTILNITRVHNVVSAVGLWGRGLAVSRAFARVRRTGGALLIDRPLHVRTLAHQHVEYRAMMHLAFFLVTLLGISENDGETMPIDHLKLLGLGSRARGQENAGSLLPRHLLRLITPLAKAVTARAAIAGLAECMESLGGVGYLENEDPELNIARLYRDANVLSIWEGTTNVMADDLVRVLKGREGVAILASLGQWIRAVLDQRPVIKKTTTGSLDVTRIQFLHRTLESLVHDVESQSADSLRLNGRDILSQLGWLVCGTLLAADAIRDDDQVAWEIFTRWLDRRATTANNALRGGFHAADDRVPSSPSFPPGSGANDVAALAVEDIIEWDCRIVFGHDARVRARM
ncbi:hypothetical protein ASPZODRAFT_14469 [Penicilliopsis zonata CBS 506.65]|uniref:Acyl-CoA dehydrogenase/oxidase C-terminal domain-containing protein n=1 Tax=Penicilliopsis zonata CBS 506.65 TaxID=1073090 RepID=A0A1L9SMR5_9EURO|nr:hypothetical protein ASPZODRAFT_14469 [Penicilliopsis zonata CBS 506.65]OJJ48327.1 hypothetical protein ASPZODRAFT_14469 [Penicilliopsis zonata CBS 506.65]